MNKVIRISAFIGGAASLALATGTLSTAALAKATDRPESAFPGDLTGLDESLGVDTIFSDMAPVTIGKLNIDTGHAMLRHVGKPTTQGKSDRQPATVVASACDPCIGNSADQS